MNTRLFVAGIVVVSGPACKNSPSQHVLVNSLEVKMAAHVAFSKVTYIQYSTYVRTYVHRLSTIYSMAAGSQYGD